MSDKQRCLLALHAHPDDESSKGAGTMARYAAEGIRVALVCATGGEEGEILNPRMDKPGILERIDEIRKAELQTACDMLGVAEVYMLGYRDSGMPGRPSNKHPESFTAADPQEAVGRLVAIIRKERPEVVLSYDESRGYEHPDHVRVHEWGAQAFAAAGDPDRFPDRGEPWQPYKLYYFATFSKQRMMALHQAMLDEGRESPYEGWLESWEENGFRDPEITTQLDVGDYVELRTKALLAHATQIDPDSWWFAIPDDVIRKVYPWEDYTLVTSTVDTSSPESDLFEGIESAD
ncbi:MAG: mycothiol conjugate amidase Mca [Actinomycetota bacterium]|jgi:mycothiol S-conjugate amidase